MLKVKCAVCGKGRFTVDCTVSSKQYLTAEMIYIEYIFPQVAAYTGTRLPKTEEILEITKLMSCMNLRIPILKLINNSSSQNKENHNRFYFSVYSLVFVSFQKIYQTSLPIQTPRTSSKILRCASYFQLSSRCLDIPMKHCLSCMIYFFKP